MARTKQRKRKNRDGGAEQSEKKRDRRDTFEYSRDSTLPPFNDDFVTYYKGHLIPDDEWEAFTQAMQTPLPLTFRVTGNRTHAISFRDMIKERFFPALEKVEMDGQKIAPPEEIKWFPNGLAFCYKANKNAVRKDPRCKEFQQFLVSETDVGNISRQEAVSMIPPLFLDVQPGMRVLDMCAAPGSKTAQIIEAVHDKENGLNTEGLVIANDADNKRCYLLVHQTKRLASPDVIITNHDGTAFPNLYFWKDAEKTRRERLWFDRILCDVPCTGDGTGRKNPLAIRKWSAKNAMGLHPLQCLILQRSLQMLAVGGRIVYSTCSMCPLENEAVVAELMCRYPGALRIVDVSNDFVDLKRQPGLTSWHCLINDNIVTDRESIPDPKKKSFLPPKDVEGMRAMGIERCMRVYPHMQDTGGFFIAVLEKLGDVKHPNLSWHATDQHVTDTVQAEVTVEAADAEDTEGQPAPMGTEETTTAVEKEEEETEEEEVVISSNAVADKHDVTAEDEKKKGICPKRGTPVFKEEPFVLLDPKGTELAELSEYYGFHPDVPLDNFLKRSFGARSRQLYYVSSTVRRLLLGPSADALKFINTGVNAFTRTDNPNFACQFRLQAEVMDLVANGFISRQRIIEIPLEDLLVALLNEYPRLKEFSEATQAKFRAAALGGAVVHVPANLSKLNEDVYAPIWRSYDSINLLLDKQEEYSLIARIAPDRAIEYKDRNVKLDREKVAPASATAATSIVKKNEDEEKPTLKIALSPEDDEWKDE